MRLFSRTISHMPYSWLKDGLVAGIFCIFSTSIFFYSNLHFSRRREMLVNSIYSCLVKTSFLEFLALLLFICIFTLLLHIVIFTLSEFSCRGGI